MQEIQKVENYLSSLIPKAVVEFDLMTFLSNSDKYVIARGVQPPSKLFQRYLDESIRFDTEKIFETESVFFIEDCDKIARFVIDSDHVIGMKRFPRYIDLIKHLIRGDSVFVHQKNGNIILMRGSHGD